MGIVATPHRLGHRDIRSGQTGDSITISDDAISSPVARAGLWRLIATADCRVAAGAGANLGDAQSGEPWHAGQMEYMLLQQGDIIACAGGIPGAVTAPPPTPVFTLDPTPVVHSEGNSGSVDYSYTIFASPAPTGDVVFDFTNFGSGAFPANEADFVGGQFTFGSITYPSGQSSFTYTGAQVTGDTTYEGNEEFTHQIASGQNGISIANAVTTSFIDNEDTPPAPEYSITPGTVTHPEGDSGTTLFQYYANCDLNQVGTRTVQWVVEPDPSHPNPATPEAFGGSFPSGTAVFPNGSSIQPISVLAFANQLIEPDKGFLVRLFNASVGTIVTATAQGIISNDDVGPVFTVDTSPVIQYEGASGTSDFAITVYRSGDTSQADTVHLTRMAGSASPQDFVGGVYPDILVNFPIGDTSAVAIVQVTPDAVDEASEDFVMGLNTPSRGYIGSADMVSCTILDGSGQTSGIPTLMPNAIYAGTLDSGGYAKPSPQINGSGWWGAAIAALSIPYERGVDSNANGQTARTDQTLAHIWIEDAANNHVTCWFKSNDPAQGGIASVEFILEGSSVTLTGGQLWSYNPEMDMYGATVRLESRPGLAANGSCLARLYAVVRPVNGVDKVISTVIALNTDARVVRNTRWIDPVAGNDANAGTQAAPWKTFERWLNKAQANGGVPSGSIVYARAASYTMGAIAKSGSWGSGQPVSVRKWPGDVGDVVIGQALIGGSTRDFRFDTEAAGGRIGVRCIWEGIRFNTDNLDGWASDHIFIDCDLGPSSGDFRGPLSLGYPEGSNGGTSQSLPFLNCSFIRSTIKFRETGGIHLAAGCNIEVGNDFFYHDDHRALIGCKMGSPYLFESRGHNSVNLTVASVGSYSGGKTRVTVNEAIYAGSANTPSYLRVLQSANGVPVGNLGYAFDPVYKGYQVSTGSVNVAGKYYDVNGDLTGLVPGDLIRVYVPGHADASQAIDVTQLNFNQPRRGNVLFHDCIWDATELQAHLIEGSSAMDANASWYVNTKAGYSISTAGISLTLNLASDDATRPWTSSSSTAALKLRFQPNMVIRINGEYRRIAAKISGTDYTLDAPLSADVTGQTAFDIYQGYQDIGFSQVVTRITDPGVLRGACRHGNTNVGMDYTTWSAHYFQLWTGAIGVTLTNSILPCMTGSGAFPTRDFTAKNNHYGLAVGNNPASVSRDTDGLGMVGAVTFDSKYYATAGVTKSVPAIPGIPYDIHGRSRVAGQRIGAVSDPAAIV